MINAFSIQLRAAEHIAPRLKLTPQFQIGLGMTPAWAIDGGGGGLFKELRSELKLLDSRIGFRGSRICGAPERRWPTNTARVDSSGPA